jgi:hypothetical protein
VTDITKENAAADEMVGRCANPGCSATFERLSAGKLFQFDMRLAASSALTCDICGHPQHVRHYWLCEQCSKIMTIRFLTDGTAVVMGQQDEDKALPLICRQEKAA